MIYCNRRDLLKYFSLGGFALAVNPLQTFANPLTSSRPLPTGKDAENFIIRNELPWALETHRSRFGIAPITTQSAFFVRNNLPTPPESIVEHRDQWRFEIAGTVETGSLTLAELKTMPVHIVATVMQCSGKGRAFFAHHSSSSPWTVGAAGCALWTGSGSECLEQVKQAVTHGVGAMPAFGAQLSQQELEALAAYVSEASIH